MTRGGRLFNKNVANREPERVSTVSEFCPVAVRETWVQPGEAPLNGGGNYNPLSSLPWAEKELGSVIPCRLIGGLHEGINEPPTVPVWVPVNPLAGEHAGDPRRETKTPWTFTAACRCGAVAGVERRREP